MHSKKDVSKKAKAAKQSNAIDDIYGAAAGNLPDQYTAWTPDGSAATPSPKEHVSVSDLDDPKKAMAALLDDDDDSTTIAVAVSTSPMRFFKNKPQPVTTSPPQKETTTLGSPSDDAAAMNEVSTTQLATTQVTTESSLDDSDDVAVTTTVRPRHHKHPKKKRHEKPPDTELADISSESDDSDPFNLGSAGSSSKATAASDDAALQVDATTAAPLSDDLQDDDATTMDAPRKHHRVKKASKFASDDMINDAFPAPGDDTSSDSDTLDSNPAPTTSAPAVHTTIKKKQPALLDTGLPNSYSAWSPDDKSNADSKKSALDIKAMEADFDSDDDDATTVAPKRHHRKKHHRTTTPPPTVTMRGEDGVIYDDDDLPKHPMKNVLNDLQGGWQSFMHKTKHVTVTAKPDTDVQIMQSLYTSDGALPSQYTAWHPEASSGSESEAQPSPAPQEQSTTVGADLPSVADFAKDDDSDSGASFTQIASESSDPVARLIRHATSEAALQNEPNEASFIEEAAVVTDEARQEAANALLAQYGDLLKSKPLQQLVQAKLSVPKLQSLWHQLQSVDPLSNSLISVATGKQAQAERWCRYFQSNAQSAAPVHQAVAAVEKAQNVAIEAQSRQAALVEEVAARTQLQKAMQTDIDILAKLLEMTKRGEDLTEVKSLQQQVASEGAEANTLEDMDVALEQLHDSHSEIADLLELALQKRQDVYKTQQEKISELQGVVQAAKFVVSQKQADVDKAQTTLHNERQKLAAIQKSCTGVMALLEQQKHSSHMATHAVGMTLKVIGSL